MGDKELRGRYRIFCVTKADEKALVDSWGLGTSFDWKWQCLERFVQKLADTLPVLQKTFKLDRIVTGDGASDIHVALLHSVQKALGCPLLLRCTMTLAAVSEAVGRQATWFEGCKCHEHILLCDGPRCRLVAKYQSASAKCWRKGRRLVELVCGHVDRMCENLIGADSKRLRIYLAGCQAALRTELLEMATSMKNTMVMVLKLKYDFLRHTPYRLLGAIGDEYAGMPLASSRRYVADCLAERDAALEGDRKERLHRVAHFLTVGENNVVRQQLEVFARGTAPLGREAKWELEQYSLAMVATRRVESVHSHIKSWQRKKREWRRPW